MEGLVHKFVFSKELQHSQQNEIMPELNYFKAPSFLFLIANLNMCTSHIDFVLNPTSSFQPPYNMSLPQCQVAPTLVGFGGQIYTILPL